MPRSLTASKAVTTYNAFGAVAVSGASTIAASDAKGTFQQVEPAIYKPAGRSILFTGLTPGINTFTLQHKSASGTSAPFERRSLVVAPLPY